MKKLHLFLLSVLVVAATSCKKDKADDSIHLKCKVDGVEKTFNTSTTAGASTEDGQSILAVFGSSAASESAEHLILYISKTGSAVTTGTYSVDGENYSVTGLYSTGTSGGVSYVGGNEINTSEASKALKIVITQIDDKTVRGTFSGEFYEDGDDSNPKKTISEGSFYVNVTDQLPG